MTKATTAPQLSPGTVIDGTYTLGPVVRTRGGSATYEATDLNGARVEVTVYAQDSFASPVALERSLRELRQLEKVSSPQIVKVLDAGKMPQGGIYEVHEKLVGRTLADSAVTAAEVGATITEIAGALAAAQKVGVLHRNLGAESILRDGRAVKLFNFAVGDPQGGVSFGAIDCIAPEQVEGKNIDERTLVYNLAALTFRLLHGQPLFHAEDTGTALLQHAASLPPDDSMPAPLFAALAKDPKARPTLSKFLGDLGAITRDFPGAGRQDTTMHDSDSKPDSAPAAPAKPAAAPAPALVTKPLVAPPPAVGPVKTPSITPPPAVGPKPSASSSTPSIVAPNLGPPSFAPPTLSPPVAPPVAPPAAPVAAPSAAAGAPAAKPRTRGWTMFMEATDGESNGAAAPGVPVMGAPTPAPAPVGSFAPVPVPAPTPVAAPTPAAPTPVAAPAPSAAAPTPAPAPAAAPGEVKPSTRGWTMIMDEPAEADAAALALTNPAAAAATPPPASPTTRGWTMLEELNDAAPAGATPTPAPAPEKTDNSVAGNTPSSRGWTMFMEAELQGKEEGQPAEAEAEPDPEFFDGQVTTESGTVVAFAPSAEAPNARAKGPEPDLSEGAEPMTSFGARLRGEPEAPSAPASTESSVPAAVSEVPSFSGNTSFDFGGLTPPQPQQVAEPARPTPATTRPAESVVDSADEVEAAGGGSNKMVLVGVVVLVIVIVAVVAMMGT